MNGALAGIRVIDFGQYLSGPLVALMLADQGAEVIRVDPPGGPRWRTDANAILQRGKKSIVLDLTRAMDLDAARRLVASADVVVESFRPSVMERLGVGPRAMTEAHRGLIYCSLPGFAHDDPRAAVEATEGVLAAAASTIFSHSPLAEHGPDPVYCAIPIVSTHAALVAANAIVAALIARRRGGRGQAIEVPLFDASLEQTRLRGDHTPDPEHHRWEGPLVQASGEAGALRCRDGRYVSLSWIEERQLPAFARLVGLYEEWAGAGYLDQRRVRADPELSRHYRAELRAVFATRTAAEWERLANPESDLAICQTTEEWLLYDEQARTTGAVITLGDPELGLTHQAGYPLSLSLTPPAHQGPRHALDADREAILASLARPVAPIGAAAEPGLRMALEGIRAVDMTKVLAGPTCCRVLAEYGADVVYVVPPNREVETKWHYNTAGSKRTLYLDLKRPGGFDVFWPLIEKADVLMHNATPDVLDRLGAGEQAVRAHRSDIVICNISAHGLSGPRSLHRGHDGVGGAVTGAMARTGGRGAPPLGLPLVINDFGTAQLSVFGTLLALFHRMRGGAGQTVGVSLAQTSSYFQLPYQIAYRGKVWTEPSGQRTRGDGPLHRLYRASDRWFFLGTVKPDALARLAAADGVSGVAGLEGEALEAALEKLFLTAPAETWVTRLRAAGLGAHVNATLEEVYEDPWVKAHDLSREMRFPHAGPGRLAGPPARLGWTPIRLMPDTLPLGWHTKEIVEEVGLGDRVDELRASGTIALTTEEALREVKGDRVPA